MANKEPREGSWWTTVPGILTALAATITAIGGLIAVLAQSGIVKPDAASVPRAASAEPAPAVDKTSNRPQAGEPASPRSGSATIAHSPAEVIDGLRAQRFTGIVITQSDGTVIPVRAGTFVVRGSANGFQLASGQSIGFDRIQHVDVVREDRLRFLLVNGQQIEADVEAPLYMLDGENDLGHFTGHIRQVSRIEFLRGDR